MSMDDGVDLEIINEINLVRSDFLNEPVDLKYI